MSLPKVIGAPGGTQFSVRDPEQTTVTFNDETRTATLVGGVSLQRIHTLGECVGDVCVIHRPSQHHMSEWPQGYATTSKLVFRLCEHVVWHYDPDTHDSAGPLCTNDCDGCCEPVHTQRSIVPKPEV